MDRFRRSYSDCFSIAVLAVVAICFLIMNDTGTTAALCWLAVVFSISFFMRPFLPFRKLRFYDGGFGLCFGGGLFLCFYLSWIISTTGICEYSDPVIRIVFLSMAGLGYVIQRFIRKKPYVEREDISAFLRGFAVFSVIFLAAFWVIGFNPLVDPGTENYMDFGFIQAIYRQKSAIPNDIWFAVDKLNYYYLGQSAAVYMIRLAHTVPEYGYNMMLATFTGMVFVMVSELASSISSVLLTDDGRRRSHAVIGGVAGGMLAAFGANTHWAVYGVIKPLFDRMAGSGSGSSYWFPDGTVYIRTQLGDPDNGKTEFPAYSAILGDLHAHVINVLFVLPLLGILFDMCLSEDKEDRAGNAYKLILISMLLGLFKGANYWDFAIYFVITGAVVTFTEIQKRGFKPAAAGAVAIKAVIVTVISYVSVLPFTLNFIKMESGVKLCEDHTPLLKLAVLWLVPILIGTCVIIFTHIKKTVVSAESGPCRSAVTALILCTIGLVLTPEFVYVVDIYGAENKRFNTMFKLTYEAVILFAIITGIALAIALAYFVSGRKRSKIAAVCAGALVLYVAVSVSYTPHSVRQWFGDVSSADGRTGISSLEGLRKDPVYGFEMKARDVLSGDDKKVLNIVEAAGDSYTHDNALSVYSGACTPAGWFVHEWMWHNDAEPVRIRSDQTASFYQSGNEEFCKTFLKFYDIDYIFVGPAEVCRYGVDRNGFIGLGDICISESWQGCDLMLIKVDRSKL